MKKQLVMLLLGFISSCGQTLPQKPATEVLQQDNGGQTAPQGPQESSTGQNGADSESQVKIEKFTFALMTYKGCKGCEELKSLLKNKGVLTSSEPPVTLNSRYSSSIAVEHCHLLGSQKPNCLDAFKAKIGFDPGLQVPFFVLYPDQSKKLVFDSRQLDASSTEEVAELIKRTFDEIAKHAPQTQPNGGTSTSSQSAGSVDPFEQQQQSSNNVFQPANPQQPVNSQPQTVPSNTNSQQSSSSSGSGVFEKLGGVLTILGQIFKN